MMNKILGIFIRPVRTIKSVSNDEPLFSGLFVFAVGILVANAGLVRNFMIDIRAGIFNIFALLFFWAGALVIVALFITGVQKLINPMSSKVLDAERFRKLIITEFYIAAVLILRPVLGLVFSAVVTWVVLIAWLLILSIAAVSRLWNVTEIKSALSVIISVVIVFLGARLLNPADGYLYTSEFEDFGKELSSGIMPVRYGILYFDESGNVEKNRKAILEAAGDYVNKNPGSRTVPFALITKAAILEAEGRGHEAVSIYRELVTEYEYVPAPVYKTAMLRLSRLIPPGEYNLLPIDVTPAKFMRVLRLWRLPISLSYYRGNMDRVGTIKEMIETEDITLIESRMDMLVRNFQDTDFMDDIFYWLARRYENEGDVEIAVSYYEKAYRSRYSTFPDRTAVETVMGYISSLAGLEEILLEQYRTPSAMLGAARIYRAKGNPDAARRVINILLRRYPAHGACARALELKAEIYEEDNNFEQAASLYKRIIDNYPMADIIPRVKYKKTILLENADDPDVLSEYISGLKIWREGRHTDAVKKYRTIIENFPDSLLAGQLQFSIALYYRSAGRYMQALREFRSGHENFTGTDYGFESALMAAEVLSENLRYHRQASNWLLDISEQYSPEFRSSVSGLSTADAALKAAEISAQRLGHYRTAIRIYNNIIDTYSDPESTAEALYKKAVIEEDIYQRYSNAAEGYSLVVSEYSYTQFGEAAAARLEAIHNKGVKHLNRFY